MKLSLSKTSPENSAEQNNLQKKKSKTLKFRSLNKNKTILATFK
ncbi:hypothetical protein PPEP_b1050 [Pseudoalteromonas peptidolytica F12-50-A1]|uniref:Uncharacterized protein n=1 Tax=Pseudoalteromonas peptidolytica F12-50-A1 TaxID=1315280 RepID=A0A8I0T628_9GAMM|nr:hypothetical protein [Pseudoalteromonas peptidolytica F12-50-A1]